MLVKGALTISIMLSLSRVYLLSMENVQGHVRQVLKVIEGANLELIIGQSVRTSSNFKYFKNKLRRLNETNDMVDNTNLW